MPPPASPVFSLSYLVNLEQNRGLVERALYLEPEDLNLNPIFPIFNCVTLGVVLSLEGFISESVKKMDVMLFSLSAS